MARPRKTGLEYFSMDCDADIKEEALEAVHGNDGFAVFFKCLREIYKTKNGRLDLSESFLRGILAKRANMKLEKFEQILTSAAEIGLFSECEWKERRILTSNGVTKRLNAIQKKRKTWRAKKGGVFPGENEGKTLGKVHKVKQSKANSLKEKRAREVGAEAPRASRPEHRIITRETAQQTSGIQKIGNLIGAITK